MKYFLIIMSFCALSLCSFGQSANNNDIVAKAIKEEINRGMNNLKSDNSTAPFFISYTFADRKSLSVSASLGSLVHSSFRPSRATNIRLLMGNNQCTDENFSGSSASNGYEIYDGAPCMENSEEGIRYTVWRDVDALYKSASATYEEKLLALKQMDIPEKSKNLPDWDKSPAVQVNIPSKPINFDKKKYEDYVKKVSETFSSYNELLISGVSVDMMSYDIYFYNTEGTEYRLPVDIVLLNIYAVAKDKDELDVSESQDFAYSSPEELPSLDALEKICIELAQKVLAKQKASKVTETYSGPVLFEGYAVAETFYSNFFGLGSPFIAHRSPISAFGFSYEDNREEKIGKKFTDKSITIEDLTGTSEYKGQKLMGYTPIDAEGIVPPKKMMLVEKGMLKNLLGNRVPTTAVPQSNGHQLYSFWGGLGAQTSSGVMRFSDSRTLSAKKLKKELLSKAKKEGNEYAYIVRKTSSGGRYPLALYRVNVQDGSEELVRSGVINSMNMQAFKNNIIAVSDEEYIHNGYANGPISIIVPNAVLFDDLEIQKEQINRYQKAPKVPAPYKEK